MPLTGGDPEILVGGPRTVTGAAAAGGRLVAVVADGDRAGELVAVGLGETGGERVADRLRRGLAAGTSLRPLGSSPRPRRTATRCTAGWCVPTATPARTRCC